MLQGAQKVFPDCDVTGQAQPRVLPTGMSQRVPEPLSQENKDIPQNLPQGGFGGSCLGPAVGGEMQR